MEASGGSHFTVNTLSLALPTHLRTQESPRNTTKEGRCPTTGSRDTSQSLSQDQGDGSGHRGQPQAHQQEDPLPRFVKAPQGTNEQYVANFLKKNKASRLNLVTGSSKGTRTLKG